VGSRYESGLKTDADDRTVIWMQKGELQTWDSKTQTHETYPEDGGRQVDAIKGASYITKGISVLVPSLLYTKAGLMSVIQATEEPVAAGTEMIDGRRCLKVTGIERWRYPSGQVTGVRPITLWIDAETYLIRKILEDTPQSFARGSISRRIVTFDPHANPPLEARHFSYKVPEP
jgi:hypothetical protein